MEDKKLTERTFDGYYSDKKSENVDRDGEKTENAKSDIGIKENGLVHLSEMAERFVSDPTEVVSIHQHVMVKVIGIDAERKRIRLSMAGVPQE